LGGKLHFIAAGSIWSTEGTAETTAKIEGGFHTSLLNQQGTLLFSRQGTTFNTTGLWKSNGTPDAAVEIERSGPGAGNADPSGAVNVNGTLFFAANDGVIGSELWKVVGNTASLVKDIGPGARGSVISNLMNAGGKLYFTANDSDHGQQLWTSDGSEAGTVRLSSISGPFGSTTPQQLTAVGNQLFFSAFDDQGWELWKSDGTAAGTLRVADLHPGSTYDPETAIISPNSSFPAGLVNYNGTLYFSAVTPDAGRELWKSDGTTEGTVLVQDLFPGTTQYYPYEVNSSNIDHLTVYKGALFFSATDPAGGRALWKSDGTTTGAVLVKGSAQGLNQLTNVTVVGGTLFFVGTSSSGGAELW
jgi:ELWxxDGT repeat protein